MIHVDPLTSVEFFFLVQEIPKNNKFLYICDFSLNQILKKIILTEGSSVRDD